jgi:hypothetical protein
MREVLYTCGALIASGSTQRTPVKVLRMHPPLILRQLNLSNFSTKDCTCLDALGSWDYIPLLRFRVVSIVTLDRADESHSWSTAH